MLYKFSSPFGIISIHVLREEDDWKARCEAAERDIISIHVLREEDDAQAARGQRHRSGISIHVLREEDDRHSIPGGRPHMHFYPRPPRGGRRIMPSAEDVLISISIHVLREEDDR